MSNIIIKKEESLENELSKDESLEDELFKDESNKDDSLEDESLENESLEDELFKDESNKDDSLEDESLENNKNFKPNEEQEKILNHIKKKLKNNSQICLLITGSAGTGKSFVIKEIKNLINEHNEEIKNLINEHNEEIKNLINEHNEEIKIITSAHLSIAAQNIDGITLFKLFGYCFTDSWITIKYNNKIYKKISLKKKNNEWIKEKEFNLSNNKVDLKKCFNHIAINNLLIIDEISTVSCELLNDFNQILQKIFENDLPFGGINVVLVGDFYQIPPIKGIPLFKIKDKKHFINMFTLKELKTNIRQKNIDFFNICEKIKVCDYSDDVIKILSTRLISNLKKENKDLDISNMMHVYPKKVMCDQHNCKKLAELNSPYFNFTCIEIYNDNEIYKNFKLTDAEDLQYCGLLKKICLRINAKVMITCNFDNENGESYSNGELGIVKRIFKYNLDSLIDDFIFVNQEKLFHNHPQYDETMDKLLDISLNEMSKKDINIDNIDDYTIILWLEKRKKHILLKPLKKVYEVEINELIGNKNTKIKKIIYSRLMFPLQLAWASTTHKLQGITLEEGVIDLGKDNFDPTMAYVALTRITDLENVYVYSLIEQVKNKNIELIKKFRNMIIQSNIEKKKIKI